MALGVSKKKPDPADAADASSISVCVDGHSGPHGTYAQGARLRSDHPAVTSAPTLWLEDGASDEELAEARNRLFDRFFEDADAQQREKERRQARRKGPLARATATFEVDLPGLPSWATVTVREGEVLLAREEVVRRHADRFLLLPFDD